MLRAVYVGKNWRFKQGWPYRVVGEPVEDIRTGEIVMTVMDAYGRTEIRYGSLIALEEDWEFHEE